MRTVFQTAIGRDMEIDAIKMARGCLDEALGEKCRKLAAEMVETPEIESLLRGYVTAEISRFRDFATAELRQQ